MSTHSLSPTPTLRAALWCLLAWCAPLASAATAQDPDWAAWDALLRRHVDDGYVDYRGLRGNPGFAAVVEHIARTDPRLLNRQQRLAFYINAYNILAIQGILNGRSPASLVGRARYFYRDKYTVSQQQMTLNTLENDLLRTLGEPRIHFAIVCASRSCPPLRAEAYTARDLEHQLNDNTRRFLNDKSRNQFDLEGGTARISRIFKWFKEDFEQEGSLQQYLARYVDDPQTATQLRTNAFKIKYLDYDWRLNGQLE